MFFTEVNGATISCYALKDPIIKYKSKNSRKIILIFSSGEIVFAI